MAISAQCAKAVDMGLCHKHGATLHIRGGGNDNSDKYTFRLLAFNPLSVGVITSRVIADSLVDGAAVVECTVQSVRHHTALRRNRCGVVAFI